MQKRYVNGLFYRITDRQACCVLPDSPSKLPFMVYIYIYSRIEYIIIYNLIAYIISYFKKSDLFSAVMRNI